MIRQTLTRSRCAPPLTIISSRPELHGMYTEDGDPIHLIAYAHSLRVAEHIAMAEHDLSLGQSTVAVVDTFTGQLVQLLDRDSRFSGQSNIVTWLD